VLFNSLEFLVFLPLVLLVHFVLIPARWERARKLFLTVASYVFYGSWSPPFVLLLLFSTALDYGLARAMGRTSSRAKRRLLLGCSLFGGLGLLGFFKYGEFLRDSFYALVGLVAPVEPPLPLDILLPVGISFYTFQTLSYTIDVYRRVQEPASSFLDFALFVSFFPQLVAGPIVRAGVFLPQLQQRPRVVSAEIEQALARIGTGFLKKVVLADTLGAYADLVFERPEVYGGLNVALAVYAYAYQIYFDFSGYSDIAIGLCRLFGFHIPENFDRPYLAASPREFWRRWHISLSTWLRDYLYVPLGGNRKGAWKTYRNVMVTMLLGGLWHGAAWTFVLWGAYHGALLWADRLVESVRGGREARLPRAVRQVITFHLVCAGWILFRSPDVATLRSLVERLGTAGFASSLQASQALIALTLAALAHVSTQTGSVRRALNQVPPWAQGLAYAAIAILVFLFSPASRRFIYFQF
jgi:alginate O-acetyltransferase complex protein AlgI